MKETRTLAHEAYALQWEDLPEEVITKAKYLILDQIGCQIGFATLPVSKGLYRYTMERAANGGATIMHYGEKVNPMDAAFCNAVFGHGFELDDIDITSATHPGVAIVPPTLALAEANAKSGKEALLACVAGYETFLHFGYAARSMIFRGLDTTAVCGAFGAAAVTGKLLEFDEETMFNAISIATTEASSNAEYVRTGGSVKRTWGALGAYAGMRSAYLAKIGLTGPEAAMEGEMGYLNQICEEEPLLEWLTKPNKEQFLILGVGHKPYSCCAGQHSVIDAAEKIRQHGIDTKDIVALNILQTDREFLACGGLLEPQNVVESQFCGRFACALRLVKGSNIAKDYIEENVWDPEIRRLVKMATYSADSDRSKMPEGIAPATVTVTLKDGTEISEYVSFAKGLPENPLTHDEAVAKFKQNINGVLSDEVCDKIVDYVMNMEKMESLTPLMSLCRS